MTNSINISTNCCIPDVQQHDAGTELLQFITPGKFVEHLSSGDSGLDQQRSKQSEFQLVILGSS